MAVRRARVRMEWRTLALAIGLVACSGREATVPPATTAPSARATPAAPSVVTLLYTTDEHGWLLRQPDKGKSSGGAAELLARLVTTEGHCPGALPGEPEQPASEVCTDPATLLLSGGDNYTGPAISSYFRGKPMAEALARMGYAASAFGNHEFDFGREQFIEDRAISRVTYLAANVHVKSAVAQGAAMPAYAIFERRGVRIGVVGLATDTTLTTAMATHFEGVELEAEEPALARAVPEAWDAGADALVLIAHECPDVLEPIIVRHPEWQLSFVGAGHCHKRIDDRAGDVRIVAPGWRLEGYARVRLTIDRSRPARHRVVSSEVSIVDTSHPDANAPAPDGPLARHLAQYASELDRALGERIGYSGGIDKESPTLGRWVAEAWRAELGTDVAIVNSGGLRQSVPKGVVTLSTVYSVLPFDNRLLVCKLTGRALLENLAKNEAVAAGITKSGRGFVDAGGKQVEPDKWYSVATIDFLYYGGANFTFRKYDGSPKETGLDWRTPVIDWTRKQRTTEDKPIERAVNQRSR